MSQVDPVDDEPTRPAMTRRERLRLSTLDEIVAAGRSLLHEGREVTLRAVAAELGFTAPAMYRYVESVAALNELLSNDIFAEIVQEMATVGEPYGNDDPAAQMVAAATAFRTWALRNTAEFQLVFATTSLSGEHTGRSGAGEPRHSLAPATTGNAHRGVEMFADFFGEIFIRLSQQRTLAVPRRSELDEEFVAVHSPGGEGKPDLVRFLGRDALGLIWLFELAWAQLYGIVTLEVFGHIRPRLIESGSMFRAVMHEIGRRAGLADDWERLSAISQEILARPA